MLKVLLACAAVALFAGPFIYKTAELLGRLQHTLPVLH
jgi:hypothetical protein